MARPSDRFEAGIEGQDSALLRNKSKVSDVGALEIATGFDEARTGLSRPLAAALAMIGDPVDRDSKVELGGVEGLPWILALGFRCEGGQVGDFEAFGLKLKGVGARLDATQPRSVGDSGGESIFPPHRGGVSGCGCDVCDGGAIFLTGNSSEWNGCEKNESPLQAYFGEEHEMWMGH